MKPGNQPSRILASPLNPDLQRAQTPDPEPALHIPHHTAKRDSILKQLFRPIGSLGSKHATQHIAMSTEILRSGMHDDIRAPEERILQTRRCKRTIDNEECAAGMGFARVFLDAERRAQRVDGRL
ncbi:hypothetical protein N7519_001121 [Penicillium mononematosum]|uniref:uncharacterized protein n=1 Tax=Penicillium mononematosum TaxID=268346 RepID=UPI00254770DE|nr:uncharacterized protein N7519_001121 [Penicillium mononematosum]KAJ6191100.1 hypothetical protein N7519_001121 [Penicillium mononematosum]